MVLQTESAMTDEVVETAPVVVVVVLVCCWVVVVALELVG